MCSRYLLIHIVYRTFTSTFMKTAFIISSQPKYFCLCPSRSYHLWEPVCTTLQACTVAIHVCQLCRCPCVKLNGCLSNVHLYNSGGKQIPNCFHPEDLKEMSLCLSTHLQLLADVKTQFAI